MSQLGTTIEGQPGSSEGWTLPAERPTRERRLSARSDRFVKHEFYAHSVVRGLRRRMRKLGVWSARMHKAVAARQWERYGLDMSGDPATVAGHRRRLRNARKQESSCRR